jgi:uncharacterized protein (DUF1800 family)
VETWQPAKKTYVKADHWTGPLQILGWKAANANGEGRTELKSYLHYLAAHPATAKRLATRLCQRFVADKPSDEIVAAVAKAYTDSGTSRPPCERWSSTRTSSTAPRAWCARPARTPSRPIGR